MAKGKTTKTKAFKDSLALAMDYTPPTHSILIGDHPEVVGQFERTGTSGKEKGVMCAGEVKEMGPEQCLYPYRASWVGRDGDVRTWGK